MAYLDHQEAYEDFKQAVLAGIKEQFPVTGSMQSLELTGLDVKDPEPGTSDDLRGQHAAKVSGGTWASPVFATLTMKDKTGKVVQTKRMRVAEIPRMTSRHSYIVDGQEYQVDSQWQLKPGVYTRRMANGQLESRFNTPQAKEFKLLFDPETKQFNMKRGKAEAIAVYPLMKALGVDDDALEQKWGKEIFAANKQARGAAGALAKFFRADRKGPPKDHEEALQYFTDVMKRSAIDPDVTKITLGREASTVDGDVMLRATHKMLRVQSGEAEDDRDALEYKNLRTTGDYAFDKMTDWQTSRSVRSRMQRQINHATDIRQVVKFGMLNDPIKKTFKVNTAARTAQQFNPLEMVAAAQQTTIMGPGGIQNAQVINNTISLKLVNPSHLAFLDPVKTPEGPNTGITLRLPTGVKKINGEAKTPLYNLKTGKLEYLGPAQFHNAVVVLPDQVTWENGKPKPKTTEVSMSIVGNKLTTGKFKDATHVLRHPSQLFSLTTNLIPFLGSTSGNRATYAGTQMEQAISLKHREAPLVQVGTGVKDPAIDSFEGILGRQSGHVSLRNGTVSEVKKDAIIIKTNDGKSHEVQLYNNFPLNEPKSMLTSTATVKVGDKVRAGDSVADTNYTKNGKLALGTNLRVAYIPFKGYNFEDGVVVSHSASQKMVSEHLYKESTKLPEDAVRDVKKFRNQHQEAFNDAQYKKLGDDGVIRVGQKVSPGDPLVIAMTPFKIKDRMGISAVRRSMSGQHTDASARWKGDYTGEVVAVHHKNDGTVAVHVRTEEPLQVGDKITGRYGNKGIVTQVLDDDKMPHTKDGKHIEVALNPSGVPGRMNLGQVLETAASKIALKTGKPYIVNNFDGTNAVESVKADLKKHGISDQEELFDPDTKQSLGKAMVGPQHMLKLLHQVEHKISVRSGMAAFAGETPEKYDNNLIPSGSGKIGAQSIGHNGLYTLLAHGAKANIREMQTWKSEGSDPETHPGKKWPSQHTQVWGAIQSGEPLPTPTPTFSFQKFTDMLKAAGVNVQKQGNHLKLLPFTDKQTLALSNGEIKKPDQLTFSKVDEKGELKVLPGGLFDTKITGGHGGKGWGHIKLPEPVPNPVFEGAIRKLTGLKEDEFNDLASGAKALSKTGKIVPLGTAGAVVAGHAIKQLLDAIDPEKELQAAEKQLAGMKISPNIAHGASTQKVDALVKKIKYLRSLQQAGMKPSEAYVIQHLPVIPPAMRPASIMDGSVSWADLNGLYKDLGQLVTRMKDPTLSQHLTDEGKYTLRRDIYDGVKAITGMDKLTEEKQKKGVLHLIAATGSQPKYGFFQQTLLKRKQDLTMRSTIVPEPALGLDEIGLPREKALQLYKPFVVRKMVEIGAARSPLSAQELIKSKDPGAYRALELVTQERPVLLKRDPALHKHSIQAFRPKLVHGSAIQIHPLTTSGYNADFDGDAMSAYVPISAEAVREAQAMFPSNNLYNEATGKVIYTPTLEAALGLFKLSRVTGDANKSFSTPAEALRAVKDGKLDINHTVMVAGKKVTAGRLLIAAALPQAMQKDYLNADPKLLINKDGLNTLFDRIAKEHKGEFGTAANRLKDLGNGASYGSIAVHHPDHKGAVAIAMADGKSSVKRDYIPVPTHSLSLEDFSVDHKTRDRFVSAANKEVDTIKRSRVSDAEKDRRTIGVWKQTMTDMTKAHFDKHQDNPSNLALMVAADVKPSRNQYRQMVLSPGILEDATGRDIPHAITRSYSEGLDLSGYWTQMHGARGGTIKKVQEVRDPGAFSKQLMQATMGSSVITTEDCGTQRGVVLNAGSRDVHDRILANDFSAKGMHIPRGTLLSPDVVTKIRSLDKGASLVVRSTLKCEHEKGVCQKCAGMSPNGSLYGMGTNLGVLSAQTLGERSVQLTLKAFHSGGVSSGSTSAVTGFKRVSDLTNLPETISNSATLAMKGGTIDKMENDATGVKVWIGGKSHHIGKDQSGELLSKPLSKMTPVGWVPPKIGMKVDAGQVLSDPMRTLVNPHDLYKATGSMERVQNFLTDELYSLYSPEGVRRQHVETVVRSMGELTKVRDAGDSTDVMRGEYRNASRIRAINKELAKQGKRPVEHSPILKGINVLPLEVQEDWMAKLMHQKLKGTIIEAASMGSTSDLHGTHPVPGMAFGAEFGLTRKDSLKPGLGHLKNVADTHY